MLSNSGSPAAAGAPPRYDGPAAPIALGPADRLLVFAPHPDDETLGTGGLLQQARALGAAGRVAFVTSGERNPWAQRASERRLVISRRRRAAFGARREGEALAALRALGVPAEWAAFWRLPDQGLTAALLSPQVDLLHRLKTELAEFSPTVVAFPSPLDLHPDHSALGVAARVVLAVRDAPRQLCYVIHNPALRHRLAVVPALRLEDAERTAKAAAIARHASQLFWRRAWMESFAAATEPYCDGRGPLPLCVEHPIALASRDGRGVRLTVRLRHLVRAWGPTTLLVLVAEGGTVTSRLAMRLHRFGHAVPVLDAATGARLGTARAERGGAVEVPAVLAPADATLFAKVERRFGFFDEAGWIEIAAGPR